MLLTVSSGGDDISDMLRQAGKRAAKALSSMSPKENNIIKNSDDKRKKKVKEAEFESVAVKDGDEFFAIDCEGGFVDSDLQYADFQNGLNLKDSVHRAEEHGVSTTHFIRIILMFILFLKEEDAQL